MDFPKNFYALTVSPPFRRGDPSFHYNDDKPFLMRLLNKCSSHYLLYPEFDVKSRLHYHGVIRIHDLFKWHKQIKPTIDAKLGFCQIQPLKTPTDQIRYVIYSKKHYHEDHFKPIIYKSLKRKKQLSKPQVEPDNILIKWITDDYHKASMINTIKQMNALNE